jgi:hypothetical protein
MHVTGGEHDAAFGFRKPACVGHRTATGTSDQKDAQV